MSIRAATAALLVLLPAAVGAVSRDDFLYGQAADGSALPFRYFVPPAYDAAQAYPLILFLHGAGERGSDNEAQLDNGANGAMKLLGDEQLALQPVFLVAPQCPTNGWWSGATLASAIGLVDQLAAEFHIDPDRVYVTGLSMGGMGTWSAVTAQPGRFAAAVPMSGNGATGAAASVAGLPFWFFHAVNDPTVGVSGSDDLVAALRDAGANAIYTRYATGGHAIWRNAYAHPLLFPWLVSQRRGAGASTAPPSLRITVPTSAPAWTTQDPLVDLAGVAGNGDYPIDAVEWRRVGGDGGAALGTTQWSASGIALADGVNRLQVTATAPSGHPPYGGNTSFADSLRVTRTGPPPEPGTVVAAINAGGAAYTASDGTAYAADTAYAGGSVQVSNRPVDGTEDDPLYNDWRYGNFAYHVPLLDGPYVVELQFADTYNSAAGQRAFDVAIEGTPVLDDFDIIASVGVDTATVRRFEVMVVDGVLDLVFSNGNAGSARLDAFRVVRGGGEPLFADGFDG